MRSKLPAKAACRTFCGRMSWRLERLLDRELVSRSWSCQCVCPVPSGYGRCNPFQNCALAIINNVRQCDLYSGDVDSTPLLASKFTWHVTSSYTMFNFEVVPSYAMVNFEVMPSYAIVNFEVIPSYSMDNLKVVPKLTWVNWKVIQWITRNNFKVIAAITWYNCQVIHKLSLDQLES